MGLLKYGYDWDYRVGPEAGGNSFMRHARAKVLGGCSSHNGFIAFWAPPRTSTTGRHAAVRAGALSTCSRCTADWRTTTPRATTTAVTARPRIS